MLAGALLLLSIGAPRIEVITMGPGPYLYSFWGHSAIRVVDPVMGDLVYNFGSVDFSGNFFLRMVRGEVEAFVGVSSFEATARTYIAEDRTLTRRILDLTPEQAEAIATRLRRYTQGGARHAYVYHHFEDNCVTRIGDEIDRVLGGALSRDARTRYLGRTLREEAVGAIERNGLWAVAVDLAMAGHIDREITAWEAAFLPKRFDEILDSITIDGRPLVKQTIDVYRSKSIDENADWTWPWIHVYLFLLAPMVALILWRPRAGAAVVGLVIGPLGLAVFILWAATDYNFTEHNWNALILPPTHLALAIPRFRPWIRRYARGHAILLLLVGALHLAGAIQHAMLPALAFALSLALALLLRSDDVRDDTNPAHTSD
jgi:hypothetical protein